MKLFKSLGIFLQFIVTAAIGLALIYLASGFFSYDEVGKVLASVNDNLNARLIIAIVGLVFILVGLVQAKVRIAMMRREKTIAFENPDGQVVVSLAAIEDYVERMISQLPQVKDTRSTVIANKRGVDVMIKAVLLSDSHIPEVTEKIQSLIKNKLQEMLGIEESINVRIHVAKLINKNVKEDSNADMKDVSRHVPFRGIV